MSGTTRRWYIPDAYIPPASTPPAVSHESICVVNDSDHPAELVITAYFSDREPQRSAPVVLGARRAEHLRTSDPAAVGGLELAADVPYALVISSQAPLHLQYSRLDSTQAAYTLMTAIPAAIAD